MKKFFLCILIISTCFMLACKRTGAMLSTLEFNSPASKLTYKDMRKAIGEGCIVAHWRTEEIDKNTVEASLLVRHKHLIVVTITYDATYYTIKYKSSENMNYTVKENGVAYIHPNYNKWVENLDNAIRSRLTSKQFNK